MKIGLIDVDGHNFPNLPLMKLSAHHKAKGDRVEMYDVMFGGKYDTIYMSKVFTNSPDYQYELKADKIIKGGTGYFYPDGGECLPKEIETIYPDYLLYNITDTAYGFLTRGCPRECEFCIVSKKEGKKSYTVSELGNFWNGQKNITLLDPNITASKDCVYHFNELIKSGAKIEFNQGLDIRCMTEEKAMLINQMKIKMLHFAWDNYEFQTYEMLKKYRGSFIFDFRRLRVYVLVNFNTTHEQDLERIYKLKELDYDPFVMIYEKSTASTETKKMARWVNNKFIFRKCERFEDYNKLGGDNNV